MENKKGCRGILFKKYVPGELFAFADGFHRTCGNTGQTINTRIFVTNGFIIIIQTQSAYGADFNTVSVPFTYIHINNNSHYNLLVSLCCFSMQ